MTVLVADDDPVMCLLLEETLRKWGYEVCTARSGTEAWEVLERQGDVRLVILDWMMPGLDGLELCRSVRSRLAGHYIYVLLLTAKKEKEFVVEGLEAGADDFLSKPFDPKEMRARLRTAARILELEERLRLQATHDTLTGLLNHGAIIEVLRKELARAHRQRGVVAHLTADLDRFKQINDTYGHLAGDAVLREVAARIRSSVREYDSVGRAGGDEFLIVAPGCGIPEGMTVAARIRDTVTSQLITAGDAALNVGISLGVAVGCGAADEDVDALLRAADSALYQSKRNGRGQARAFEPKLTSAFAPPGRTPTARNLRVARTRSSTPDHDD